MSSTKPRVAIFGATANTGGLILEQCLSAGFPVAALCRTPSKLAAAAAQYPHLTVVQGDVHNIEDVQKTLRFGKSAGDSSAATSAEVVVSTIGSTMDFSNPLKPRLHDAHICRDGTANIVDAVGALDAQREFATPPLVALLSTAGIAAAGGDVPFALLPLYHWMLADPHRDKKDMEAYVRAGAGRATCPALLIRPSLLTDGAARGVEKLRVGVEGESKTPVGYTISRRDLAAWVFERVVANADRQVWNDKTVTLTY